jgi:ribonuclease BN (tRNA processing enzyme)
VLIHEAYTQASFDAVSPGWQAYRLAAHTSSLQLAEIAAKAKPKLLILYHRENPGGSRNPDVIAKATEEQMMKEIKEALARFGYGGKVVNGHDLDIY